MEEQQESIVWNLGSFYIDLISGSHLLKSLEEINNLDKSKYNFEDYIQEKAQRKVRLSKEIKELLKKMLQKNPKNRIKLGELFKEKKLCENIVKYAN